MPMMGTPWDVPLPKNVNENAMIESMPRMLGSRRACREPFQSLALPAVCGQNGEAPAEMKMIADEIKRMNLPIRIGATLGERGEKPLVI